MAKHRLDFPIVPRCGQVFLYGGRPDRSGAIWVRVNALGGLQPIKRRP